MLTSCHRIEANLYDLLKSLSYLHKEGFWHLDLVSCEALLESGQLLIQRVVLTAVFRAFCSIIVIGGLVKYLQVTVSLLKLSEDCLVIVSLYKR